MLETAWSFVGGLSDLYITCMIWFVLNDESKPDVLRHGNRSYSLIDVLRPISTDLNESLETEIL